MAYFSVNVWRKFHTKRAKKNHFTPNQEPPRNTGAHGRCQIGTGASQGENLTANKPAFAWSFRRRLLRRDMTARHATNERVTGERKSGFLPEASEACGGRAPR